jgi:Transglycosylase SLT domain
MLGWRILEALGLFVVAGVAISWALGAMAEHLAGPGFWSHLVPFVLVVLGIGTASIGALWGWLLARRTLVPTRPHIPAAIAMTVALLALHATTQPPYQRSAASLRAWLGGRWIVQQETIAHQVFAAYRRSDLHAFEVMWDRARFYEPFVIEAGRAFALDPELLMGIAAAESSFLPRTSNDGGHGLFQITAPPIEAVAATKRALGTAELDVEVPRHNAYLAAATYDVYLRQVDGDPFLALLAYNIGPKNGGFQSIMKQYGARDFVTIQPYLQHLPRDYPIRVLSSALSYRLWKQGGGRLPRYEDGTNATRIQAGGIPGLPKEPAA